MYGTSCLPAVTNRRFANSCWQDVLKEMRDHARTETVSCGILVREQHSREDFDIMSVLRPVIPLLAGTCLSSASYNTRELINGLYFWFPLIGGLMTHVITDRQIVDFLCLAGRK